MPGSSIYRVMFDCTEWMIETSDQQFMLAIRDSTALLGPPQIGSRERQEGNHMQGWLHGRLVLKLDDEQHLEQAFRVVCRQNFSFTHRPLAD
jgi:hypothetical protein